MSEFVCPSSNIKLVCTSVPQIHVMSHNHLPIVQNGHYDQGIHISPSYKNYVKNCFLFVKLFLHNFCVKALPRKMPAEMFFTTFVQSISGEARRFGFSFPVLFFHNSEEHTHIPKKDNIKKRCQLPTNKRKRT